MFSIKLGWYSPVYFRPVVEDGRVVKFAGRVFLCADCAKALGADRMDEGQVANVSWHSKGYDVCGPRKCLCDKDISDGEEIWLTIEAK